MAKRIVIGLVGPIASGKGVVAEFLKDLGFTYQSLSDRLRDDLKEKGISPTRENLQNYGNYLREAYGNSVLAEKTVAMLSRNTEGNICIDSIRNPGELLFLKETLGAFIIGVDAPEHLRVNWYLQRALARGEDPKTPKDFYIAAKRDLGYGESQSGQQVSACLELSDIVITNLGSKEELFEQLMEIVPEIRSRHKEK